jgi:preprotein translocase subunit SecG
MTTIVLIIHLMIAVALVGLVLVQRSEGGALGIGGGGGGFMTARGSANLLTRTTAILAALFFATAIGLTVLAELDRGSSGILDAADDLGEGLGNTTVLDALNSLQPATDDTVDPGLAVPTTAPATETPAPATDTTTPLPNGMTERPLTPTPGTVETDPGLAVPTETPTDQPATPAPN